MKELLWAERQKLRRSKIIWITVFATIMVAVIVFAQGQFVFDGSRYVDLQKSIPLQVCLQVCPVR